VANTQRPTGGDVRQELEPHWIGQSTENLERHVPRLCDESRLGERKGADA
jgi:hypothetical protein